MQEELTNAGNILYYIFIIKIKRLVESADSIMRILKTSKAKIIKFGWSLTNDYYDKLEEVV